MNTTTVAWITAVCSAVTGLLTFLATKGVDAYLRIREDRRKEKQDTIDTDRKEQHRQEDRVEMKEEIKILKADIKAIQADHVECIKQWSELSGEYKMLIKLYEGATRDIEYLREWKHKNDTPVQTAKNVEGIVEILSHRVSDSFDWRLRIYVGWKSQSEFWLRWTTEAGLHYWLHPTDNRWASEPEQLTMPTFPTREDAEAAIKTAPEPPK